MSDDELFQSIRGIAQTLQSLNQRAVLEYTPVVQTLVRSRSSDAHHIEQTLDELLGFCGYEPALALFKELCRHYWAIDPAATAFYVDTYREMWDSEAPVRTERAPDGRKPDGEA